MLLKHPAPFSASILEALALGLEGAHGILLDPFAGIGRVHSLSRPGLSSIGIELEVPWLVANDGRTIRADACSLPLRPRCIDYVVTSPCYGNRFADHHQARDGSTRRSYTHDLRAMTGDDSYVMHPRNAGTMPFSSWAYKVLHQEAWAECFRVLKRGGLMLLNVSNFVQHDRQVKVAAWHLTTCLAAGFDIEQIKRVATPRYRKGQNYEARVDGEMILYLRRPATS